MMAYIRDLAMYFWITAFLKMWKRGRFMELLKEKKSKRNPNQLIIMRRKKIMKKLVYLACLVMDWM
jgi:hypothetical protein